MVLTYLRLNGRADDRTKVFGDRGGGVVAAADPIHGHESCGSLTPTPIHSHSII